MDLTIPLNRSKSKETIIWTFLWSLWVFLIFFQTPALTFDNVLDDSWRFSLTWLNGSSQALGVQTFFTYGPLSEWLGYGLPGRPSFSICSFLVQVFFFASLVHVFFKLTEQIQRQPAVLRWFFYFLISVSLFGADLQRTDENFYQLWLIGHVTLFYSENSSRVRRFSLILWTIGGALLLNYKGSVGFGCLTLLFIAWVFDAVTEKSRWHAFVYFLLYILTFETCFKAVSGHWNSTDYLRVLFNLSSGYSETHAMVPPNDSLYYWGGLFAVAALAMAWNYIRLRVLPRFTIIFFLMSIFLWLYFEYKHGFVRADVVHINWFFKDIFTILLFWAIGHQTHKRCASTLTILFLILALASFISAQQLLGTRTFSGLFNARLQEVKSLPFNTVIPNQHKPQELANDKLSLNLYQNLFQFMHREAATFQGPQRPTLSVVSNQVILLRYLPDFETHFMPSLLQYISAGCPSIQRKNRAFLTDPSRPDYLLFGNLTPDESCLPIYQSHTLAPLLENYEQISYLDGFYILKRKMGGPENVQTILPHLSTPPPSRCFLLAHSILKFIFKAPVLMLRVAFLNQETQKLIIMNDRITLIDLQNGVFSGPFSFPRNFHQPPGSQKNTVIVLKVQTYWTGWGSWFMKPWAHLPIEVKYIDPRDIPTKR